MNTDSSYPHIAQAILLLLCLLGLQVLISIFIGVLSAIAKLHILSGDPAIVAIGNALAFAILLFWGRSRRKENQLVFYHLLPFQMTMAVPLIIAALGFSIIFSELDNLLRFFLPMPQFIARLFVNLVSEGAVSFIALAIIAPFTEEFFFRAFLLRAFLARYSTRKAIVVSAVLFTLFHLNPYQFLPAFFLGIFLAWVFIYSKSIWPCIIVHSLCNSMFIIVSEILHVSIPGYTTIDDMLSGSARFQPLWFDILGIVLVSMGIWFFIRTAKENG